MQIGLDEKIVAIAIVEVCRDAQKIKVKRLKTGI
jgi:hypothetical protein